MASENVGARRRTASDAEVPAELTRREAQDRPKGEGASQAQSPVDSVHVDAPKQQDNERGHRAKKAT